MTTPTSKRDAALDEYAEVIALFAEQQLAPYWAVLERSLPAGNKEINDAVWGTVVIRPAEIVLLDSPLLQRLRRLRQLGVVHLIYGGASHSRLEHSLGVLHQATALLGAVNESLKGLDPPQQPLSETTEQLLRLSALCHDIGHGLMSHVSENAVHGEPTVNTLRSAFAARWKIEQPSLSEMAAFFIVRSPAFKQLLHKAWAQSGLPPYADPGEFISSAIIGTKVDNNVPLLQELITGPFDADKLDYLHRDAIYCGIPRIVDTVRLVRKVRAAAVPSNKLPQEIAQRVQAREQPYLLTGIAQSGARTLDELALARALQRDKVYRHHKVRAAEAMIASALSLMSEYVAHPQYLPLHFLDEQFLDVTAEALDRMSGGELPPERVATIENLLDRFKARDLFIRAFAWEQAPAQVGLAGEEAQKKALHKLDLAIGRRSDRGALAGKIACEVENILEVTGRLEHLDGLVRERLKNYIWIDPPGTAKGRNLLNRALLVTDNGGVRHFRDDFPDTEGWSDQYLVNRDAGYVFSPRQISEATYLASEYVLRTEFGVRFPKGDRPIAAGLDLEKLVELRDALATNGYYDDKPTDLRPVPDTLLTADAEQVIDRFVDRASAFSPAELDLPEGNVALKIGRDAVLDYGKQFPADHAEDVLAMLDAVEFVRRSDITAALATFLDAHTEFRGSHVCPLGSAKDSGAPVAYFVQDLAEKYDLRVVLPHELNGEIERVVFVDDFIGSGRQVIDMLESWFGLARSADLGEERSSDGLPEQARAVLKAAGHRAFVFHAGLDDGPASLNTWLENHDMPSTIHVARPEDSLPSLAGLVEAGKVSSAFVDEVAGIGTRILQGRGMAGDLVEQRCLGYGNHGLLLAFPLNVPAHTVTALWDESEAEGSEWLPLLRRRRKR